MRKRDIRMNFYVNEEEEKLLINKSIKAGLTYSDFLRKLITEFDKDALNKLPTEDTKEDIIQDLISVRNFLGICHLFEIEKFTNSIIDKVKNL